MAKVANYNSLLHCPLSPRFPLLLPLFVAAVVVVSGFCVDLTIGVQVTSATRARSGPELTWPSNRH